MITLNDTKAPSLLLQDYLKIRKHTEQICSPLQTEDYIPQPVDFASPPKWHLAHSTWFFEEMILKQYDPAYKIFDPAFGFLFNSYYQSVGDRSLRTDRGNITRPGVVEVYAYRKYIDAAMTSLLSVNVSPALAALVTLGINHEQQHQELLMTDLKYALGHNPIFPVYKNGVNEIGDHNTGNGWLKINAGLYHIGFNGEGFCFDNELGSHKVYLQEFSIAQQLVTNGEFLNFIDAGGYREFKYWLDEGWQWVQEKQIQHPLYWHKVNGSWHYFTLGGLVPVDKNAMLCHVSFYEAQAYATWKGARLPTEFEWEASAGQLQWGKRWEWTYSAYLPYPGFNIAPGALGEYNGKFMINQMVLRGASVATANAHSRASYRNFFHPHFQWQFSGIRLAK